MPALAADAAAPVLWHIPVSHYSEKVRWALDLKRVECRRRAPMPGMHMAIAATLTRGAHTTFPLLSLEGRNIADSSAIIAALEQYAPSPPLYPDDPAERARALALEDYFDERLGPQIRLLAWHELRRDPERMAEMTSSMLPGPMGRSAAARAVGRRFGSAFVQLRYRVASDDAAAAARSDVLAALDRLEAELGDRPYLVGARFTVADLTAAALFYPLVNPPEGPNVLADQPAGFAEFREPLIERAGYQWVARMFARHRR